MRHASHPLKAAWVAAILLFAATPTGGFAFHPTVSKILPTHTAAQNLPRFGAAVALTEKYLVVGEPQNDDLADDAGRVRVYDAKGTRLLRTLTASDASAFARFGAAVAVSGDLALIGAPGVNGDEGRAYLIDLKKGTELQILAASDAAATAEFGATVGLVEKAWLVVGAPGDTGGRGALYRFDPETFAEQKITAAAPFPGNGLGTSLAVSGHWAVTGAPFANSMGEAYLYDLDSLDLLRTFTPSDGGLFDAFGTAVAIAAGQVAVGAPLHNTIVADDGAVYLYRIADGAELAKVTGSATGSGDDFGSVLAMEENLLVVGAPKGSQLFANEGDVYVFSRHSAAELGWVRAPDFEVNQEFGAAVAICGNRVVVGAPGDQHFFMSRGAVYRFEPVIPALPLEKIAALRDFAPDTETASFARFGEAVLQDDGGAALTAVLRGAPRGKNKGLWLRDATNHDLRAAVIAGDDQGGGVKAGSVMRPVFNDNQVSGFEMTVGGTGINRSNNRRLIRNQLGTTADFLSTGDTGGIFGGGVISKIGRPTQDSLFGRMLMPICFKKGVGGIDAESDTALIRFDSGGANQILQEGSPGPASVGNAPHGHLTRVSNGIFACPLQSDPATNEAVFGWSPGVFQFLIARRGSTIPSSGTIFYSNFLGEMSSNAGHAWRATLSGDGIGKTNNESLFASFAGIEVARRGDPVPGLPAGVVWDRFLQFAAVDDLTNAEGCLFLAKIKGPGVTRANDCGLFLYDSAGGTHVVLREGDPAPGCDPACIGSILRVEMPYDNGHFAVLASLTRASKTSNLALLTGTLSNDSGDGVGLWRPSVVLRKGTRYQSLRWGEASVKSLGFPASGVGPGGACGIGYGEVIVPSGRVLLQATFSNRGQGLLRLDP
ncbi:MAG: hypothetical protein KDM91_16785 [Verrucomicrobiae bacterium]|nr:hypothetical protein [Verrucomicrobiae bacterium]